MGVIKGICISEKRGTAKHEIEEAVFVKDWGIEKDAHAGHWHRQVSLLSYEKIEEFRKKGAQIGLGAFGENLIVEGYDFRNLPVGTRFQCGDVILEMTQIGKGELRSSVHMRMVCSADFSHHFIIREQMSTAETLTDVSD